MRGLEPRERSIRLGHHRHEHVPEVMRHAPRHWAALVPARGGDKLIFQPALLGHVDDGRSPRPRGRAGTLALQPHLEHLAATGDEPELGALALVGAERGALVTPVCGQVRRNDEVGEIGAWRSAEHVGEGTVCLEDTGRALNEIAHRGELEQISIPLVRGVELELRRGERLVLHLQLDLVDLELVDELAGIRERRRRLRGRR